MAGYCGGGMGGGGKGGPGRGRTMGQAAKKQHAIVPARVTKGMKGKEQKASDIEPKGKRQRDAG